MSQQYTPPAGFYDLPFMWIFDSEDEHLTDGNDYPNLQVYIQGGYGDFILRRVVGLDRVLDTADTPPGRFQLREFNGDFIQEFPVYAGGVTPGVVGIDLAILPERIYKETGQIRFGLYNVKCECE